MSSNCGGDRAGQGFGSPQTDPVTGVVRAGWPVTDTLSVPITWVSGYYYALLRVTSRRRRHGRARLHPVRRPRSSDEALQVLVQVPVNTWQAYNPWGRASIRSTHEPRAGGACLARPSARIHGAGTIRLGVQPRALPRTRVRPLVSDEHRNGCPPGESPGAPSRHRRRARRGRWTSARETPSALLAPSAPTSRSPTRTPPTGRSVRDGGRTIVGYKEKPRRSSRMRHSGPCAATSIPAPECGLQGVMFYRIREHQTGPVDYTATDAATSGPWFAGTGFLPAGRQGAGRRRERGGTPGRRRLFRRSA